MQHVPENRRMTRKNSKKTEYPMENNQNRQQNQNNNNNQTQNSRNCL